MFLIIVLMFSSVTWNIFAGSKPEVMAELNLDATPRVYIAPDSQGNELRVPLSNLVSLPDGSEVKRYEFNVFDSNGELVSTFQDGQERFRSAFGGIKWVGDTIQLPAELIWKGTYNLEGDSRNGSLVPDGDYAYQVVITDDRGHEIESPPLGVTIDNSAPEVYAFLPTINIVFSPDGDRIRDSVIVRQVSSREPRWTIRIQNSSKQTVYEEVFENDGMVTDDIELPQEFSWGGTDNDGKVQAEGEYSYVVIGEDRAGNTSETPLPLNIIISYTAEFATIVTEDGIDAFSPNGDGIRDDIRTQISLYEAAGISDWSISVVSALDPATTLVYLDGPAPVIDRYVFDGMDSSGQILPDGNYIIVLGLFADGQELATSELFVRIDTTPPRLGIELVTEPVATVPGEPFYFGGSDRNTVVFSMIGEPEVDWIANISNENTAVSTKVRLSDVGLRSGRLYYKVNVLDSALQIPDGRYTLTVKGYDMAGNFGTSPPIKGIKDSRLATVSASVDGLYLAPQSEGASASVPIQVQQSIEEGASQYLLSIVDANGKIVRSHYKRKPFAEFAWDGFTNSYEIAPDGEYSVTYKVQYYNGNTPEITDVGPIILDSTKPVITLLGSEQKFFSPDGDSVRDDIRIQQKVETADDVTWDARIINSSGDVLRIFEYGDAVDTIVWKGDNNDGNIIEDGDYLYILRGSDVAGNVTEKALPIIIGATSTGRRWIPAVDIQATPQPFSPDGDNINDTITITVKADKNSGIKSWKLSILDPRGNVFINFPGGEGEPNETIVWDGLSTNGELVQAAEDYRVVLSAVDVFENTGTTETVISTDILVIREGDRLRIRIPSIYFAGFLSDLLLVHDEQLESNLKTVRKLAQILNRYHEHRILIEGHAAHIFWQDADRMEQEQEEVLLPLSRSRAENVRRALIILGVTRSRMKIEGIGGAVPIVQHSDRVNLWKNRRVEFILDKEKQTTEE